MLKRFTIPAVAHTILLLSCTSMLLSSPVLGDDEIAPLQTARQLQEYYSRMTSITFDFTQITRTGSRERYGKGNAVFIKQQNPDQETQHAKGNSIIKSVMRWNYSEPDKQIIINDGTTLSIYTDKDKQLIKTSSRELDTDITYAFFAGTRNLLDDFEALSANDSFIFSSAENLQAIKLVPRTPHNQIKTIQIWSDDNKIIRHLVIEDHFDSQTELNFENISVNSLQTGDKEKIEAIISFPIPPGTEIITQ